MSDIGLIMNALLGLLLIGALVVGWRLEGRLKALRASHASFAKAVEDLDRAAARAEQGLADLRAATDEAAETLAGRIERAGALAQRLEKLTADAVTIEQRLTGAVGARPALAARPAESREVAFSRFAERYGASAKAVAAPTGPLAEAAARNDLILEDEAQAEPAAPTPLRAASPFRDTPELSERLERLRALARPRGETARPRPQAIDDELFEAPRRAAGGAR